MMNSSDLDEASAVKAKEISVIVLQRLAPIGGIETLVLRLIDTLSSQVSDLVIFGTAFEANLRLPPRATVVRTKSESAAISDVLRYITDHCRDKDVVVVSLHPWSLVSVYIISYSLRIRKLLCLRSFHLVTHSRAMFFSGTRLSQWLVRAIFLRAPFPSTYFMNEPARTAHEQKWQISLSKYPVLRLPLHEVEDTWKGHRSSKLKIVSVGRLVPFKGYNRAAPAIVEQLCQAGLDVEWNIWGDGEDRAEIERDIKQRGLTDRVRLRGGLAYEQLGSTVIQSDLFVGMGTAVLEAALSGVPAICAIENSETSSYGFLSETPQDSVGDVVAGAPETPIKDKIALFARMTEEERSEVARRCRTASLSRSETMADFAAAVINSQPWQIKIDLKTSALVALAVAAQRGRDRVIANRKS